MGSAFFFGGGGGGGGRVVQLPKQTSYTAKTAENSRARWAIGSISSRFGSAAVYPPPNGGDKDRGLRKRLEIEPRGAMEKKKVLPTIQVLYMFLMLKNIIAPSIAYQKITCKTLGWETNIMPQKIA